jgi:SWI/SNF-related matrix-associated actin-dependent regulator of chromatin subfamily A3
MVCMTGLVDAGEQVRLIREPQNKYDRWAMSSVSPQLNASFLPRVFRNAIAVQNIGRTQVGHVPRQTAAKLAPLMDGGLITVEGSMNEGNRKQSSLGPPVCILKFRSA